MTQLRFVLFLASVLAFSTFVAPSVSGNSNDDAAESKFFSRLFDSMIFSRDGIRKVPTLPAAIVADSAFTVVDKSVFSTKAMAYKHEMRRLLAREEQVRHGLNLTEDERSDLAAISVQKEAVAKQLGKELLEALSQEASRSLAASLSIYCTATQASKK